MKSILISGPSCAGKSTLIDFANQYGIYSPKLYTTRPIKAGENRGSYYFREKLPTDIISWQSYGYEYGTLKDDLKEHKKIILSVSCFKIKELRQYFENSTTIFIYALFDILEKRMKERNREKTDEIEQRLDHAKKEISFFFKNPDLFDYYIFNIESKYTFKERFYDILNKENLVNSSKIIH